MAQRGARPRLRVDPRFVFGLLLVVASVAGMWAFIGQATRGVTVYAARHTIVVGDAVQAADLTPVQVRIGTSADRYLTARHGLQPGMHAAASIRSGEFVPRSALATGTAGQTGRIVVPVAGPLPSPVKTGSVVTVWASAAETSGGHAQPRVLTADAVVSVITKRDGIVSSDTVSVEVQVDADDVGTLVAAVADRDVITLVADASKGL